MKNAAAKRLHVLLCLLFALRLTVLPVVAAETSSPNLEGPTAAPSDPPATAKSVRIWFNDPSTTVGGEVTVTLSSSVDIASIEMTVLYDADCLNYVGCSGGMSNLTTSAEDGCIRISDRTASGEAQFYLELFFVARMPGTTVVRSGGCECTDGSGSAMDTTIGTAQVSIRTGAAATTPSPTPRPTPTATPTAVPTASPTPTAVPTAEPTAIAPATDAPAPTPFIAPTVAASTAVSATVEDTDAGLSPLAIIAVIVAGIFVIGVGITAGVLLGGRRNRD